MDLTENVNYNPSFSTQANQFLFLRHIQRVSPENLPKIEEYQVVNIGLNAAGIAMVKVSACIFLLRIVHQGNKLVPWLVYINLAMLVPICLATVIINYTQCVPLEGLWNPGVKARCIATTVTNDLLTANSGRHAALYQRLDLI